MTKIIFATKNQGKLKEIRSIMSDVNAEILSMEEAGIDIDVIEDGKTFEENALKKATEIMKVCNEIVLADDSGLEVDYLDKAPGVYSARYMGEDTPYSIKNAKIIELLSKAKGDERSARFVSVIAASFPNGETFTTRGTIEGLIDYEIKGENGFGYDPIFLVPSLNKTTAQLTLEEKNEISHRGKSLKAMKDLLKEKLGEKL